MGVQTEEREEEELGAVRGRLEQVEARVEVQEREKEELEKRLEEQEGEVLRLRGELVEVEEEREVLVERLRGLEERVVEEVVGEEREEGDGASIADEPVTSPPCQGEGAGCPSTSEELSSLLSLSSPRPLPLPLHSLLLPQVLPLPPPELGSSVEELLATTLPVLVPSLVVSTRPALVPLLLHALARHGEPRAREALLALLFTLVKRPEGEVRARVAAGLQWLLAQPGWGSERVEEEVLPHCWEQVSHKHPERRELVAVAVGVVARRVQPSLRASLLLSLLLQLVADREPGVATAAVRWANSPLTPSHFNSSQLRIHLLVTSLSNES